jgi:hypothetical protein
MSYSLKTVPLDRYKANLGALSQVVGKAAADVEGKAKTSIVENSGKYKQYGNHWSSPPGTPPNNDTGTLANSIGHKMTGRASAEVFVSAKYAVPLELGWTAKSGGTVPARPFLRPAVEYVAPSFQAACKAILRGK